MGSVSGQMGYAVSSYPLAPEMQISEDVKALLALSPVVVESMTGGWKVKHKTDSGFREAFIWPWVNDFYHWKQAISWVLEY